MKSYELFRSSFLFIVVMICDRVTKLWALNNCSDRCDINPFLACEVTFNRGISWGFFHSTNDFIFLFVSSVITLITIILAWYTYKRLNVGSSILGEVLVLAGSCSNLIDRVLYRGVVDFIVLSYNEWSWPHFNIADFCIVIGVGVMLMESISER